MNTIEEIKQKLDIVEIVGEYVRLQKSGRNFRALCPFHSEKTPSFFIFPEQQSWHCFGACGTGGDIFSFVMKKEGIDFSQALRLLAEKSGVALPSPALQNNAEAIKREKLIQINEAAAAYFHHLLQNTPAGEKTRNYLVQRGISSQTINDFQLGFSPDSFDNTHRYLFSQGFEESDLLAVGLVLEKEDGSIYDRFRNRLMFPIRDAKGHVIGFGARALDDSLPKYLNSPQTLVFDKSNSLYGIDRAREPIHKKNMAILMEGYMDVLTAHQYGWNNAVASMGTALTGKQLSSLKKLTKNLILALDADVAGEEAESRTMGTIPILDVVNSLRTDDFNNIFDMNVKVVVPSRSKDPDEEIRKDTALWAQSIERAKPIMEFMFDIAKDKIDSGNIKDRALVAEELLRIICKIENSIIRGYYIQEVARILKIKPNDLRDRVNKIRIDERKHKTKVNNGPVSLKSVSLSTTSPIEEICLGLLLQYPSLKSKAKKLNENYFEYNQNKEIFLKWLKSTNINSLKESLDGALYLYLDSLLNRAFPPTIMESEENQRKVLNDCIIRLQEKFLKNLEHKKAKLLATEAEAGGNNAELAKLDELGAEESKQLKHVFEEQSRRRHSMV